MSDLTPRQQEILAFIMDHVARKGYAPTIRDIGRVANIRSPNGVMCHINALVRKGYIKRDLRTARSIQISARSGKPSYDELLACLRLWCAACGDERAMRALYQPTKEIIRKAGGAV